MLIGVDLGTTFCCMAYITDSGLPKVIPNSDGALTTPSVIYFDGKNAYVGAKANQRKITLSAPIYEFVKRDMGAPIEIPPDFYSDESSIKSPKPYEIAGFKYGPEGISAILLRYLKKCAINYFKRTSLIKDNIDEKNYNLDAIITVPAYFGDKERQATKLAGYAAGLNVVGIINEPTAASLTYGHTLQKNEKLMVFDLGGGTFDITILEIKNGEAYVISSEGAHTLGGKDWDDVIQRYIIDEFYRETQKNIPDELLAWDIPQKAIDAKISLSEYLKTEIAVSADGEDFMSTLYRTAPEYDEFAMTVQHPFYFNERSENLLAQLRLLTTRAMEKSRLDWDDLDDIILAGGSCRMNMIPQMLEKLTCKKIKKDREGFSFDTAIAIGAAIYGYQKNLVHDIASSSVGIKIKENGREFIEHLICKGEKLPCGNEQKYYAGANALLEVYEGESDSVAECIKRGKVDLDNIDGYVLVNVYENIDGELKVIATYPNGQKELQLFHELFNYENRAEPLKSKILSINLNL